MTVFRVRLLLDFLAVALIIACLAYWWLENLYHELFGTALFALVILHNVFNRRWYGGVARRRLDVARVVNLLTIVALAVAMTVMLVTSLLVSRDLFPFTALEGGFAVREIHMFAGYWVLLIIAVHLGTRWQVVMNVARGLVGFSNTNAFRTAFMRITAFAIFFLGIESFSKMAVGEKLMLSYSLDIWDFNEDAIGFFANYAAIVGLIVILTHYGLLCLQGIIKLYVSAHRRCAPR